jgi:hypothetical protein
LRWHRGAEVSRLTHVGIDCLSGSPVYRNGLHATGFFGGKYTPPSEAALILGLEAVFAVVAAYLVLEQNLLFAQICGCALIFLAL